MPKDETKEIDMKEEMKRIESICSKMEGIMATADHEMLKVISEAKCNWSLCSQERRDLLYHMENYRESIKEQCSFYKNKAEETRATVEQVNNFLEELKSFIEDMTSIAEDLDKNDRISTEEKDKFAATLLPTIEGIRENIQQFNSELDSKKKGE